MSDKYADSPSSLHLPPPPLLWNAPPHWPEPPKSRKPALIIGLLVSGAVVALLATVITIALSVGGSEYGLDVTSDVPTFDEVCGGASYGGYVISPDGTQLAYYKSDRFTSAIFVDRLLPTGPAGKPKKVSEFESPFFWAGDSKHLICCEGEGAGSYSYAYSLNVATGSRVDIAYSERPRVDITPVDADWLHPTYYYFEASASEDRTKNWMFRANIVNGDVEAIRSFDNLGSPVFLNGMLRATLASDPETHEGVLNWYSNFGRMVEVLRVPFVRSQQMGVVTFHERSSLLYLSAAVEGEFADLYLLDAKSGELSLVERSRNHDIVNALISPEDGKLLAVAELGERIRWRAVDPSGERELQRILSLDDGDLVFWQHSRDLPWVIAEFMSDIKPASSYLWNMDTGLIKLLGRDTLATASEHLAKMRPIKLKARDGLEVPGYLTLPAEYNEDDKPDDPLPMVILVHGGPHARDAWGWDPEVQLLAAHGFAVLQVNYRGSTGLGVSHFKKGCKELRDGMYRDVLDAVDWAIREEIARPDRIACMGWSFGGYMAMWSCIRPEGRFQLAIAINGVSDLVKDGEYEEQFNGQLGSLDPIIGDADDPGERIELVQNSPITHVPEASIPILLVTGEYDSVVNPDQSHRFRESLEAYGKSVNHLSFYYAGHGLGGYDEDDNSYSTRLGVAITEFLARHWGTKWRGAKHLKYTERAGVLGISPDLQATRDRCRSVDNFAIEFAREERDRIHSNPWPTYILESAATEPGSIWRLMESDDEEAEPLKVR